MPQLPSLFLSHGAPDLLLGDSLARRFLTELGQAIPRPAAILVISAHWETATVMVTGGSAPPTIRDFAGFPDELYRREYHAPGSPALAYRVVELLRSESIAASVDSARGLDHGVWIPLSLAYPDADIPIVQLSLQQKRSAKNQLKLGRALRVLRSENVLVIGSGGLTHDLPAWRSGVGATPSYVTRFADWIHDALMDGAIGRLLSFRDEAPEAQRNHPTDEHIMPLFIAMGAGGEPLTAKRLHHGVMHAVLRMDVYAFS